MKMEVTAVLKGEKTINEMRKGKIVFFETEIGTLSLPIAEDQFMEEFVTDSQPRLNSLWKLNLNQIVIPQLGVLMLRLDNARELMNQGKNSVLNNERPQIKYQHVKKQETSDQKDFIDTVDSYNAEEGLPGVTSDQEKVDVSNYDPPYQGDNEGFNLKKHEEKPHNLEDEAVDLGDSGDINKSYSESEKEQSEVEEDNSSSETDDLDLDSYFGGRDTNATLDD